MCDQRHSQEGGHLKHAPAQKQLVMWDTSEYTSLAFAYLLIPFLIQCDPIDYKVSLIFELWNVWWPKFNKCTDIAHVHIGHLNVLHIYAISHILPNFKSALERDAFPDL